MPTTEVRDISLQDQAVLRGSKLGLQLRFVYARSLMLHDYD